VRTDRWDEVINPWFDEGNGCERVHLCKMPEAAPVVTVVLQEPIPFPVIRPLAAILTPVMGMAVLPASLAVSLVGLVIGISGPFLALPLGFPGPLAGLVGTELLVFDTGIGPKTTAAMGTADGVVHGFLLREATNLPKRPHAGSIRTKTKADAEGKAMNRHETSGEEKRRG
jgi:hypothetical protein